MTDAPVCVNGARLSARALNRLIVAIFILVALYKNPLCSLRRPRRAISAARALAVFQIGVLQRQGIDALGPASEANFAALTENRYADLDHDYAGFTLGMYRLLRGEPRVHKAPGSLLLRLSAWLFSRRTFVQVIEPVLSDIQVEFFEALHTKQPRKARWVQCRGYAIFWSHVAAQFPVSLARLLVTLWRIS